jgi:hypothetical protein
VSKLIDVWLPRALCDYLNEQTPGLLAVDASEVPDEPWTQQDGVRIGAPPSVASCFPATMLDDFVTHAVAWMNGLAPDSKDRVLFVCGPGGELAWRLGVLPDEAAIRSAVAAVLPGSE